MAAFDRVLVPLEFDHGADADEPGCRTIRTERGGAFVLGHDSCRALVMAQKLAEGGEVWLVHAVPDVLSYPVFGGPDGFGVPLDDVRELNDAACANAEDALGKIGEDVFGVTVKVHVGLGSALPVILDAIGKSKADAVVMAASSRGRVRRALLGSTADKVIRRAQCPVVVLPAGD